METEVKEKAKGKIKEHHIIITLIIVILIIWAVVYAYDRYELKQFDGIATTTAAQYPNTPNAKALILTEVTSIINNPVKVRQAKEYAKDLNTSYYQEVVNMAVSQLMNKGLIS